MGGRSGALRLCRRPNTEAVPYHQATPGNTHRRTQPLLHAPAATKHTAAPPSREAAMRVALCQTNPPNPHCSHARDSYIVIRARLTCVHCFAPYHHHHHIQRQNVASRQLPEPASWNVQRAPTCMHQRMPQRTHAHSRARTHHLGPPRAGSVGPKGSAPIAPARQGIPTHHLSRSLCGCLSKVGTKKYVYPRQQPKLAATMAPPRGLTPWRWCCRQPSVHHTIQTDNTQTLKSFKSFKSCSTSTPTTQPR